MPDLTPDPRKRPEVDASTPVSISDVSGVGVMRLARTSREAARKKLRAMGPELQAQACVDLRPEVRVEFLMLGDSPEDVVPLLPDTEVCVTIRAGGMSDASWLLEMATPEQRQACFDLDCWDGPFLEPERATEWVDALVEAGPGTLVRAMDDVDPELWLLVLRTMTEVAVLSRDATPPPGAVTVDGVVYWLPLEGTEPGRIQQIAQSMFDGAPQRYWQMVYGLLFESPSECEEYALRWRSGRLADLGFPEYEHAMHVYRPLHPEQVSVWERDVPASAVVETSRLPHQLQGTLLGESLARLDPPRAADVLGYVLGVANAIAVTDRMRLSDVDSIPRALQKAVRGIDRGLRELSKLRDQAAEEILDATQPRDLFRIGVKLDPSLRPPVPSPRGEE